MLDWIKNLINAIEGGVLPWVDKVRVLLDVLKAILSQPVFTAHVDLVKGPNFSATSTDKKTVEHAADKLKKIQAKLEAGGLTPEEEGKLLSDVIPILSTLFGVWVTPHHAAAHHATAEEHKAHAKPKHKKRGNKT